jgi:hypothetical protein
MPPPVSVAGAGFRTCAALTLSALVCACAPPALPPDGGFGATQDQTRSSVGVDASSDSWNYRKVDPRGASVILTPAERDLVLHLNLVRADPPRYAQMFIEPRRMLFRDKLYLDPLDPRRSVLRTREGPGAVVETALELRDDTAMGVLAVSRALTLAAREHALDQSRTGALGHEGSGGTRPEMRIEHFGQWDGAIGEAIAYGPVTGREVVGRLLIDDGVPSRGHRRNILNPNFQLVGIAIAPHPRYGWIAVIDLATQVTESGH